MLASLFVLVALATDKVTAPMPPPRPTCVWNCQGEPDSQRPNCADCSKFILCLGGSTFNYTCPQGLHYDKDRGLCNWAQDVTCGHVRTTTPPPSTAPLEPITSSLDADHACITSCDGMEDGDYHSCQGCDVFASCTAGSITDGRMCPVQTTWDDVSKECSYTSRTCDVTRIRRRAPSPKLWSLSPDEPWKTVTSFCLLSCNEAPSGVHQSCISCSWYIYCLGERHVLFRCPGDFEWDDSTQSCVRESSTCRTLRPRVPLK